MRTEGPKPLKELIDGVASHPSFGALLRRLSRAYTATGTAGVLRLAAQVEIDRSLVPPGLALQELWTRLLEQAAPAGRLPALIDAVLADPASQAHHKEIRRLTSEPPTATAVVSWWGSPYPGLQAFTARWAPVFFGRDREVEDLLQRLVERDYRFLAAMGASGSGKSSLLRAGVIPKLEARGWLVPIFRPAEEDGKPMVALRMALRVAAPHLDAAAIKSAVATGQAAAVCELMLPDDHEHAEVLLFVDQFEELFTQVAEVDREPFIAFLAAAAATPRMRVALAMRNDLMAVYQQSDALRALMQDHICLVQPPAFHVLEAIIREPAKRANLGIDDDLVTALQKDSADRTGVLSLLAFTLDELYRQCKERGRIGLADYLDLGGVGGALAKRADVAFDKVQSQLTTSGVDAKALFDRLFRQLARVNQDGTVTRQRVPLATLCPDSESPEALLIQSFSGGKDEHGHDRPRLLITDDEGQSNVADLVQRRPQAVVEVIHERLFTDWPLLAGVIQNYRDDYHILRQVQHDATEWDRLGRPDERLLWPHERQVDAETMRLHLGEAFLGELEREFLIPEWRRLIARLENIELPHRERLKIGDRLEIIGGARGDPRPGVGLNDLGLPDVLAEGYWSWVEPGHVVLKDGHGLQIVPEGFWIGRYPVTWVQYQDFLQHVDGHASGQWWKDLVRRNPEENPSHFVMNRPAVNVSWYDSVAYCRWLSWRLWPDKTVALRLATEQEWQLAAGGGSEKHPYSWLGDWDGRRANTGAARLGQTSAVGLYPAGVATCGALDMAGNVWEWCSNEYENPNRNQPTGSAARVVRGGSWNRAPHYARTSYRSWNHPNDRVTNIGFRLVLSSTNSPAPLAARATTVVT